MTTKPQQLTFDLPFYRAFGREDFFESESNSQALKTVTSWPHWPVIDRNLLIVGPTGSGKTHLAHVWMELSGARLIDLDDPTLFNEAEAKVVIEDIDQIQTPEDQEKLFHIFNHMQYTGGWMLMTSSMPVNQVGYSLPDLHSRLNKTLPVLIDAPDDALLRAVLIKQLKDRGVEAVSERVIKYCIPRMERSFPAAAQTASQLSDQSLMSQRPITLQMAKDAGL